VNDTKGQKGEFPLAILISFITSFVLSAYGEGNVGHEVRVSLSERMALSNCGRYHIDKAMHC